jgi:hypothetical protein
MIKILRYGIVLILSAPILGFVMNVFKETCSLRMESEKGLHAISSMILTTRIIKD